MNYQEAMTDLISHIKEDFESNGYTHLSVEDIDIEVLSGSKYDKIIENGRHGGRVIGFVCKKDNPKKGFNIGDILMAASYNAPSTNFARGSIFDPQTYRARVRFHGIV